MNAAKVDVLAVLDREFAQIVKSGLGETQRAVDLGEARAAVARLIIAAQTALDVERITPRSLPYGVKKEIQLAVDGTGVAHFLNSPAKVLP